MKKKNEARGKNWIGWVRSKRKRGRKEERGGGEGFLPFLYFF